MVNQLIGGEWVAAESGEWVEVENPARREVLALTPDSDESDSTRAVAAAKAARGPWKALAARDRGALLIKIAKDAEELPRIIASETGNDLRTQARGEAASGADIFRFYGQIASEQKVRDLPARREPRQLHRA
ncbi:Aldehyde dehydrogenase [Rhodococcus wratislaviensis]|uniref:Aldehyde dehydrogenase n=1 Tax=Rhodococcus wratislaviensis TaxID=44752 RepID=A0A402C2X0_RHOWR|nr:aldehyde dehydrogenase family protein [Rhodococcus wratislaviensis]GCE37929.1 Aldehyde dehydrogenase [Rhodococcus wratislaviensis]